MPVDLTAFARILNNNDVSAIQPSQINQLWFDGTADFLFETVVLRQRLIWNKYIFAADRAWKNLGVEYQDTDNPSILVS